MVSVRAPFTFIPLSRVVEPVEKRQSEEMSKRERPPYLTYKRRSRLGESFWYPQFGHFFNRRGLFLQPR